MTLRYLDFDFSEDTEGLGTFDAMASTAAAQVPAVHAEIAEVLAWAHATFPSRGAPVGEEGEWDYDLQGTRETASPETIEFDAEARCLRVHVGPAGATRHTVSLAVTGTPAFCEAFRERFAVE